MNVFDELIKHFGSLNKLAGELDVTSVAVNQWFKAQAIPAYRAIQIESMTNGKFKAKDLIGD